MLNLKKKSPARLPEFSLQSSRIYIRPPNIKDYQSWKTVRKANRSFLKPFEPTWPKDCLSETFFKRRLKRQIKNWIEDRGYAFLIFTHDGSLVGGMNINNVERGASHYASLGYWITEELQGQGYMSEALNLSIQYCFENLHLHRINVSCLLNNSRSKNLLLRANFTKEGMAKKYLKIDGKWQDHFLFGLTIEDWKNINNYCDFE